MDDHGGKHTHLACMFTHVEPIRGSQETSGKGWGGGYLLAPRSLELRSESQGPIFTFLPGSSQLDPAQGSPGRCQGGSSDTFLPHISPGWEPEVTVSPTVSSPKPLSCVADGCAQSFACDSPHLPSDVGTLYSGLQPTSTTPF